MSGKNKKVGQAEDPLTTAEDQKEEPEELLQQNKFEEFNAKIVDTTDKDLLNRWVKLIRHQYMKVGRKQLTQKERDAVIWAINLAVTEYECSDDKWAFKQDLIALKKAREKIGGKSK